MPFNTETARKAGKKSGATRKTQKPSLTEGLAAAAGSIGVAVEVLQKAKRAGCPGFCAGNRIDTARVEEWLLLNGDAIDEGQALNAIRRRNILAKITAEKIAHDELFAKFVPAADVAEASRRCSDACATVARKMLPDTIRDLYILEATGAFRRIEKDMARKTPNRLPSPLETKEPSESSTLDDLRGVLLGWKTRLLELKNGISNGEWVEQSMLSDMIASALNQAVSIARKFLDTSAWNALCTATKEAFALALAPTPLPII